MCHKMTQMYVDVIYASDDEGSNKANQGNRSFVCYKAESISSNVGSSKNKIAEGCY